MTTYMIQVGYLQGRGAEINIAKVISEASGARILRVC